MSKVQATFDLVELMNKLSGKERWMVAAWAVEGDKIKLVERITHRFPTGDFLPAIGQLANNCHEEAMACQNKLPSDPLPPAEIFEMPAAYAEALAKQQELQQKKLLEVPPLPKDMEFVKEEDISLPIGEGFMATADTVADEPVNENGKPKGEHQ